MEQQETIETEKQKVKVKMEELFIKLFESIKNLNDRVEGLEKAVIFKSQGGYIG